MQKRLYFLVALFLISSIVFVSTTFSSEKIIDVEYTQLTKEARKQVDCLADNIYFEAAHEPEKGRIAVAMVTLNRVQDPRYPKDICSVVKQRVNYTCQFSWFCEEGKRVSNSQAYREAKRIAIFVYANYEKINDVTYGALFYHADYVSLKRIGVPGLQKTAVIGRHIFYKEGGKI
jgi:spore germination cell wall hydrolase CwlJ-like protein